MSSFNYAGSDTARRGCAHGGPGLCGAGHWSGANIAAMVLGFIIFVPLGIVVLVWTLMGRPVQELPAWVREKWRQTFSGTPSVSRGDSDNVVFNEYQQTQYDRIREIKDEIRRRSEAFRAFRSDARRRRDQKEFEDFMATNPDSGAGPDR
ncbi:MAG: DUF2852 domain-containing protein [Gammaproteobacteria bacterium]|nr:DUF2852 domain-containing protein [Gammaproteobacteria bacterium]